MAKRKSYKELWIDAVDQANELRWQRDSAVRELTRLRGVLGAAGRPILQALPRDVREHVLQPLPYECVCAAICNESRFTTPNEYQMALYTWRGVPLKCEGA
jgi:hypothetical protein